MNETPNPLFFYISGPYRATTFDGVLANIHRAWTVADAIWKLGHIAICPHLNTAFMSEQPDSPPPNTFIEGDLKIIDRCDAVVMLPGWTGSRGASRERDHALLENKIVITATECHNKKPLLPDFTTKHIQKVLKELTLAAPLPLILQSLIRRSPLLRAAAATEETKDYPSESEQEPSAPRDSEAGIEVNSAGGQQSRLDVRCDLLDGPALLVLSRILKLGADKYAPDNWRLIPTESHLNHTLYHLFRWLAKTVIGKREDYEDHLAHAFCRLMMAVAQRESAPQQYSPCHIFPTSLQSGRTEESADAHH